MSKWKWYTATQISYKLGCSSMEVNAALAERGLQDRVEVVSDLPGSGKRHKWVATEAGRPLSEIRKGNKGLTPYEMLVWKEEVLDMLGFVRPPTRAEFEGLNARIKHLESLLNVE